MSLLNVAVFSTVYSGGPTADDFHDDAIVLAAAVISDLTAFLLLLASILGGDTVVAFIPDVACVPAAVSGHDMAVILAVACCWRYCCCLRHHCCCLHPNCGRYSCCCLRPFSS